ncbi:MAG: pilin N-terminal domain-containing protein [Eubacteriales bacterium]|jgi:hypothetical protein
MKKLRRFAAVFSAILCVIASPLIVKADTAKKCSLTIIYSVHDNQKALKGADFSIVKIADLIDSDAQIYQSSEKFRELDIVYDGMNEKESEKRASEALEYIRKSNIQADYSCVTDDEGKAEFSDLSQGIYLVYQTGSRKNSDASLYYTVSPFLVKVPDKVSGKWTYEVTAYPKTETTLIPTDAPAQTNAGGQGNNQGIVQTGDSLLILGISVISGALLVAGFLLSGRWGNRHD